jgi:hypothetical protein
MVAMNDLEVMYEVYLMDFDPTPQFAFDEPYEPLSFEEWLETVEE